MASDSLANSMAAIPNVQEVSRSLQNFGISDYSVFVLMLASCGAIGIYFGFVKKSSGEDEYLVGGRNMKTFPVSLSLIASYISGISLLGTPTEIYVYGVTYLFIGGGVLLAGVIMSKIYLPVFHDLKLTSTYEYLEKRFDKRVRIFGSVLFTIGIITWLPIVIYVPALAFNQVTGINVHVITPFVCIVCIFYTCVGGLKAVVWTDVVQSLVMFGAMLLVVIKGTMDVGGTAVVIQRNLESGRLEFPDTDWNPLTRHTIWALVFGSFCQWLQTSAVNQTMMQRYLSLRTLESAKRALWFFVFGALILVGTCGYAGMVIYATYQDCDPLTTKLARAKDQLLPLLVMDILGEYPGLPGLFVAGVFSAALSSLSTGLNSMAAVVLEDFIKPFRKAPFTPRIADILMKVTVVTLGTLCAGLVYVVEKMGTHVLQLSTSLGSITHGPSFGIFTMGVLIPWINAKGALVGGLSSLGLMAWLSITAQAAISSGHFRFEEKPVSTEGCTYTFQQVENLLLFSPPNAVLNGTDEVIVSEPWALYRLSYLWYTLTGALVSIGVGLVFSLISSQDVANLDPQLLAPFIRPFLKVRPDALPSNNVVKLEMETTTTEVANDTGKSSRSA